MARKPTAPAAPDVPGDPPFAAAWAALVYALCAMSLAWPALAGRFLVNSNSDQYLAGYSFREFAASYFKAHGGFPQWEPYIFGGMPYVAAMHGDIFYPTFLLRLVMPVDAAMSWGMILHFFLAGFATWWFLRRAVRFSYFASLTGGVAYMMGGQISSLLSAGHDGKLFVSALFPVALIVVTRGVRDGRRWAWGVLAIVVGLAVLSPHPQLLQYLLLTCGAWALFLAFGGVGADRLDRRVAIERLGLALGAVVLGACIGAIQYLPVREYVAWSPRAGGRDYAYATSYSLPIEEMINFYLPQFSGILDNYWGRNGIHFHSEYVGAAVLMLAAAAFGGGWSDNRRRIFWFWVGTGAVSLLWGLGGNTPFYQLVYHLVPGTKFFRAPMTVLYVNSFAIAVLATLGTERLLEGRISTRYAYGWLIGAGVVALYALAGGFTALAQNLLVIPQFADRIDANATAVRLGALRSLLFVGLIGGTFLLRARGKVTAAAAGWAIATVCAADLWSIERYYWSFSAPASKLYASDPTIEYLKRQPQPVRVVALPMSQAASHDPFLAGDALWVHRVRTTLGYHGNELGRFDVLGEKDQGWRQIGNPTFWALTNSHFFLVDGDSLPIEGAKRVVGPVTDATGVRVSLFELPGEQPYAWVAPAITKYPDASVLEAFRTPNFPVRSVALFDTSSKIATVRLTSLPAPLTISTNVTTYEPGHVALTLSAPAPKGSALVVSENFYPGWHATVDGKPAEVERADFVLMGVPLPEGTHQVELRFDSATYQTGKAITVVSLIFAALATLGGAVAARTRAGAHGNA